MELKPLVSVIIPVYNVEKYLVDCIESVINQTYRNLEIIMVDDGSTDKSGNICDEYKAKDDRIIVIHKENGGLSEARNYGLDILKGEYVFFIDSDDYMDKKCIEIMLNSSLKTNADIVICDYVHVSENREIIDDSELASPNSFVLNGEDAYVYDYGEKAINNVIACAKLYRSFLYNDIRYPVGRLHEDEYVTYILFGNSKIVSFVDECLYKYRVRTESIMNNRITLKNLQVSDAFEERITFFSNKGDTRAKYKSINYYYSFIAAWAETIYKEKELVQRINIIYKEFIKEHRNDISIRVRFGLYRRIILMNIKSKCCISNTES